MLQHPVLRSHLPETHWFTDSRTSRMLNTYSSVFIKPNHGSGGSGIIRVKRLKKGYEVRSGSSRKFVGSRFVLKAIKSYRKSRHRYLVQKGLRLAKYHGSIFDTRIYLQKPRGNGLFPGWLPVSRHLISMLPIILKEGMQYPCIECYSAFLSTTARKQMPIFVESPNYPSLLPKRSMNGIRFANWGLILP